MCVREEVEEGAEERWGRARAWAAADGWQGGKVRDAPLEKRKDEAWGSSPSQ